jgi:hypothetical protein
VWTFEGFESSLKGRRNSHARTLGGLVLAKAPGYLAFIEKSPKMLRGYGQRDDKVFGKIGLLWQKN